MNHCEYCGRGTYLSDAEQCKGCGSPFPLAERDLNIPARGDGQWKVDSMVYYLMSAVEPTVTDFFDIKAKNGA